MVGVVGHTGSAQTLEAGPIYADVERGGRRALVAVTPTATNPLVTRGNPWVFRVCPTDADAARALARYATDSLGARRVALVYRNDLFGRGFNRTFRQAFERGGGVVVERDPYLAGITEFEAYAERIVRRGADALVIAGGAEDAREIMRAVRAAGAAPPVLGTDDLAALERDGASADLPDVRYTAFHLTDAPTTAEAVRFDREYRRRFGRAPDHRAALAHDAALVIGRAVLAVGADRREIRDWLARVGSELPEIVGATGPIRFDPEGDAVDKPVHIKRLTS